MTAVKRAEPALGSPKAHPIRVDAKAAVALARELVRVRSVRPESGGAGEAEAAQLVAGVMLGFGWEPEVTEVAPGRPNVIATLAGGGGPGPLLALEGHLDVVTEGDLSEWSVDPFEGVVRSGRLYGRGAADMKAGLAAMLHGARALQRAGPFPGSLRLLVLSDEEGMMLGAKRAVADGALSGVSGVIVCEPEGGEICPTSKGAIRVRVDFTGRMAHGAMPQEGASPIPALAALVMEVGRLEARLQGDHPEHPTLGRPFITPTVMNAGDMNQMNVSPGHAVLALDIRTIPGIDHSRLLSELAGICAAAAADAGVDAGVVVLDDRPPVDTPRQDPLVVALARAHAEETGEPARFGGVPGTTDGTIFSRDAGVPSVVYGPGGKWIAHRADEFVEIAEIPRYARVYARAAQLFLSRAG